MTSLERLTVAALMAASAGLGATGAVYLRPLQPAAPPVVTEITPPPPPIRTVTWFKAHPDEITQKLAACNDNPGVAMHDPECFNASDANNKLAYERRTAAAKAEGLIP